MGKKKGQAAIEFLTTYGWALLTVLVMIGALAYFGVLDASSILPEKCVFGAGIGCKDYAGQVSSGTIRAQLLNSFGYTITINGVGVDVTGVQDGYDVCVSGGTCSSGHGNCWCNLTAGGADWRDGTVKELIVSVPSGKALRSSDRPKVFVELNYTKAGSSYGKTVTGTIGVKPQ